jgi:hypothetical protein
LRLLFTWRVIVTLIKNVWFKSGVSRPWVQYDIIRYVSNNNVYKIFYQAGDACSFLKITPGYYQCVKDAYINCVESNVN